MMITMTVDDNGETTKVDTIVFESPDIDFEEIMKDIEVEMNINEEKMKEIHMDIEAELSDLAHSFKFEFEDQKEELKEAMEELKNELKNLEVDQEVEERLQKAMEKLEEAGKYSRAHVERFIIDDAHPVFISKDSKVEVIVDEDGEHVKTKVFWVGEDGEMSDAEAKELKVWVDANDDDQKKVIIKSNVEVSSDENVFIVKKDGKPGEKEIMEVISDDVAMINSSNEKDIDKAISAGLPIDKSKLMEELDLFIEIKDDQEPIMKLKTNLDGKLKATAYNSDFKKIKKLDVTKEEDFHILKLNFDEMKKANAAYILLEQDGKTDLMRIEK